MRIVVDTNIIFSTILNSNSLIGDLVFNSHNQFEFYSCGYMRYEIQNHWKKLKKISKLSEEQLQIAYTLVLSRLKFINEEIITKDVDIDDIDFVALSAFLDAKLWTGDKILYKGLRKIGFRDVLNTAELSSLRI